MTITPCSLASVEGESFEHGSVLGGKTRATGSVLRGNQHYTDYDVVYGSNGMAVSQTWNNAAGVYRTETWTAAGAVQEIHQYQVAGQSYTDYDVVYGANGKAASETWSNGQAETWTYNPDGSYEAITSEPAGSAYSLLANVYSTANIHAAQASDLSSGAGALQLFVSDQTLARGAGTLSLDVCADSFALDAHTSETITATNTENDMFDLSSGFGRTSIISFMAATEAGDTLSFQVSMFDPSWFSGTSNMNAEILALLSHATGTTNTVISDSAGDALTLIGVSKSTLLNNPEAIRLS